jgi:hypothetical protein
MTGNVCIRKVGFVNSDENFVLLFPNIIHRYLNYVTLSVDVLCRPYYYFRIAD